MENNRNKNDNKQMCHFCIQRCIDRWAHAVDEIEFEENDAGIAANHAHTNCQFEHKMNAYEKEIRAYR